MSLSLRASVVCGGTWVVVVSMSLLSSANIVDLVNDSPAFHDHDQLTEGVTSSQPVRPMPSSDHGVHTGRCNLVGVVVGG